MLNWRGKGILLINSAACFIIALSTLLFPVVAAAQEEENKTKPIVRPAELSTEEDIVRFIMSVLSDRIPRPDPFVKKNAQALEGEDTYQVENKPRPTTGFGRYDVDSLTLMAIWKDDEGVVAMFKAPDSKVFISRVGEEAYDGRVVEISLQGGYVKFLQELKAKGSGGAGKPNVKYVERIVHFRR